MAKVTGIGGVVFKSKGDPAALAAWYQKQLGMPLESWGGSVLRSERARRASCGGCCRTDLPQFVDVNY